MTPAEKLRAAREALATWEAEKAALNLRLSPTLQWTRAWLEARNKVAEILWSIEWLEKEIGAEKPS